MFDLSFIVLFFIVIILQTVLCGRGGIF